MLLNLRTLSTYAMAAVLAAPFVLPAQLALGVPAWFGLAPDNNQSLLVDTIRGAKRKIFINIYQFDSSPVKTALLERIRAGVTVEILLEGEPLGRISPEGVKTTYAIRDAMIASKNKGHRFFVMTNASNPEVKRRYVYNHAKYVIVDDVRTLVSSENFTGGGHTDAGTIGNRGWNVVLDEPGLAAALTSIFREDSQLSYGDVIRLGSGDLIPETPSEPETLPAKTTSLYTEVSLSLSHLISKASEAWTVGQQRPVPTIARGQGDVAQIELILSPGSEDPLKDVIRDAQTTLDVEQMSLPSTWREPGGVAELSPLVAEIVKAGKRGVRTRVILNDESVFGPPRLDDQGRPVPRANEITVDLLNQYARCYHIPVEARIIRSRAAGITYVHNKGVLVDGKKALVSSINGTRNSNVNNRETAVLLESADAAKYYSQAFNFDWYVSRESFGRNADYIVSVDCPALPKIY